MSIFPNDWCEKAHKKIWWTSCGFYKLRRLWSCPFKESWRRWSILVFLTWIRIFQEIEGISFVICFIRYIFFKMGIKVCHEFQIQWFFFHRAEYLISKWNVGKQMIKFSMHIYKNSVEFSYPWTIDYVFEISALNIILWIQQNFIFNSVFKKKSARKTLSIFENKIIDNRKNI